MTKTFLLIILLAQGCLIAQQSAIHKKLGKADSSQVHLFNLADGSSFVGKIRSVTKESFKLETAFGIFLISISSVQKMELIDESLVKQGKLWFPDPNRTRMFFAPTGRMLEQGKGYYQNIYLFVQGMAYGVTDYLTLNGGFSLFPSRDFQQDNIFYLIPKLGVNINKNLGIATGAILYNPGNLDENYSLIYGVVTLQNSIAGFSAGVAVPVSIENEERARIYTIGTELRISKHLSLITENWLTWDSDGFSDVSLSTYGIRIFGKRFGLDLALITPYDQEVPPYFPYFDFFYNF